MKEKPFLINGKWIFYARQVKLTLLWWAFVLAPLFERLATDHDPWTEQKVFKYIGLLLVTIAGMTGQSTTLSFRRQPLGSPENGTQKTKSN